jgi:hypothetical protein
MEGLRTLLELRLRVALDRRNDKALRAAEVRADGPAIACRECNLQSKCLLSDFQEASYIRIGRPYGS